MDCQTIKNASRGRWEEIYRRLAPEIEKTLDNPARHVPCPMHGGRDGFRVFRDYRDRGACICNTCGAFSGFDFLMALRGWSFRQAAREVALCLGIGEETDAPRVVSSVERGETCLGRVLACGAKRFSDGKGVPFEGFELRLGPVAGGPGGFWILHGRELARECAAQGVAVGDTVLVTRVREETVETRAGTRRRTVWRVERGTGERELREEAGRRQRLRALEALFSGALPAAASPVETYLRARGCFPQDAALLADIRCEAGATPAMLAAVRDARGNLVTLHRTALRADGKGKALTETPKRFARLAAGQTVSGCAVRIGRPAVLMGVAEGIETALSAAIGTGLSVWAAVSARGLEQFDPPEGCRALVAFADRDRSGTGEAAAAGLARRMAVRGIPVAVALPAGSIPEGAKGVDWNDVARGRGGFPLRLPPLAGEDPR